MPDTAVSHPDFESAAFLKAHAAQTLAFYDRTGFDPAGGFFHCFRDDGSIYNRSLRHLVSSARFVVNYANAYLQTGDAADLEKAAHGLAYLEAVHRQQDGSYAWEIENGEVSDGTVMAYGHAFVLLAAATAQAAGLSAASPVLDHVWSLLEARFWRPDEGAYADEYDAGFAALSRYRGQNANMHMCEACIAAWKTTAEVRFLDRAEALARKFAGQLANEFDGMLWEHYDENWRPDMQFNRDRPNDLFKPWGFQTGHQIEWAKLLLMLAAERPANWYLDRAITLYGNGMSRGRDHEHGGLVYGFAPNGDICAGEKYFWVHCEAIATAWRLYVRTGEARYRDDYNRLWGYAWDHFVDHEYGAWFRILTREGHKIDDLKSPPGKTDYHTLGACWDVLAQPGPGR